MGINDQDFWFSSRDPSCKQGTKQLDQESSSVQEANKKEKKLSGGEQIAIEMNYWTLQNATALEQRRLKKMTKEVWAMENIRIHYSESIADLTLQEFSALVREMQKRGDKYGGYTTGQYYLLLARGSLCDQFIETFLQVIQDREHVE